MSGKVKIRHWSINHIYVMTDLVSLRDGDSLVLLVPVNLVLVPQFWHKTKEPETGGGNRIARHIWQSLRFIFKHFVIRKSKMCFLVLFHCTLGFFLEGYFWCVSTGLIKMFMGLIKVFMDKMYSLGEISFKRKTKLNWNLSHTFLSEPE